MYVYIQALHLSESQKSLPLNTFAHIPVKQETEAGGEYRSSACSRHRENSRTQPTDTSEKKQFRKQSCLSPPPTTNDFAHLQRSPRSRPLPLAFISVNGGPSSTDPPCRPSSKWTTIPDPRKVACVCSAACTAGRGSSPHVPATTQTSTRSCPKHKLHDLTTKTAPLGTKKETPISPERQ